MNTMRLTIGKARKLINRELGISGTALAKTPDMNDNPKYPHYSLQSGNLSITLFPNWDMDGKIIVLHIRFRDGLGSIHRYFYADTVEEATEFMEKRYWEDTFEKVEDNNRESMLSHLERQARLACQKHFEGSSHED